MAAALPIPVYTSLEEAYANLGTATNHAVRWNQLTEEFIKRFGRKPTYIARAPGRVNLIGEHIDYTLFGVFPAAVERDILIACAPRPIDPNADPNAPASSPGSPTSPGFVTAENLSKKYPPKAFVPMRKMSVSVPPIGEDEVRVEEWHIDIDKQHLNWESYVKAGYYGVLNRFLPASAGSSSTPVPVDILVTGTVPAGSGLSSSAAMVVASTLTFLAINDKLSGVSKGELVEMAMENEKRVGVNSGGMDQAASVISTTNSALYITFFPKLSAQPIPLPSPADPSQRPVFVCANSLVVSDKVVHSKTRYNLRVVETLVAARVLARALNLPLDKGGKRERVTLREVLGRFMGVEEVKGGPEELPVEKLKEGLEKIDAEVERVLRPAGRGDGEQLGFTLHDMIELSGLDSEEFHHVYLSWVNVEATHFQLYKRAKHVFSEALRVLQFREVCAVTSDSSSPTSTSTIRELGRLMNESQESCAKLYECSCPELDELTRLAKEAGAYGSRLTGAGWGGCTVSLVPESEVEPFIAKVAQSYGPYRNLEGEALKEVLFATKPSSGAFVYKFE